MTILADRSKPKKTSKSSTTFPFFSLPIEIRAQILSYVCVAEPEIRTSPNRFDNYIYGHRKWDGLVRPYSFGPEARGSKKADLSSPLHVSRAMYAEAARVLYSENVFSFSNVHRLRKFLRTIGEHNRALIRRLELLNGNEIVEIATADKPVSMRNGMPWESWRTELEGKGLSSLRTVYLCFQRVHFYNLPDRPGSDVPANYKLNIEIDDETGQKRTIWWYGAEGITRSGNRVEPRAWRRLRMKESAV